MADELLNVCSQLRITEEEEEVIDLSSEGTDVPEDKLELLIVGKVQSVRPFNFMALKNTMNQVWALSKPAIFWEIENGMFIILFFHWKDKEKVLDGRPWSFDQKLLLLQELDCNKQPSDIELNVSPFWIRLYNMSFEMRSIDDVKLLAGRLGKVLEVEDDGIGWDRFMRARIELNTLLPLRRVLKVRNKKGDICTIELKYERLPFFCFNCGVMGHTERDCSEAELVGESVGRQWGTWLKDSPRKGRAKRVEEALQITKGRRALVLESKPKNVHEEDGSLSEKEEAVKVSGKKGEGIEFALQGTSSLTQEVGLERDSAVVLPPRVAGEQRGTESLACLKKPETLIEVAELKFSAGSGDKPKRGSGGKNGVSFLASLINVDSSLVGLNLGKRDRIQEMEMEVDETPGKRLDVMVGDSTSLSVVEVGVCQPRETL